MLKTLMLAAALGLAGTAAMAQTATQPSTTPATRPAPTAPATAARLRRRRPPGRHHPGRPAHRHQLGNRAELRVLPGIGEARAKAIIAGRPYRGKDELVRKNILTQGVYDGIQARSSPASAEP